MLHRVTEVIDDGNPTYTIGPQIHEQDFVRRHSVVRTEGQPVDVDAILNTTEDLSAAQLIKDEKDILYMIISKQESISCMFTYLLSETGNING